MRTFHLSRYLSGQRPSPQVQKLNAMLHQEPLATCLYTAYWSIVLLFGAPIVGVALLYMLAFELFRFFVWKRRQIEPKSYQEEQIQLAVLVTGCDSGIGKEAALRLASEGFVVFAGCLQTESIQSFIEATKNATTTNFEVVPLMLDVTNETQVQEAYKIVQKWLDHTDFDPKKRLEAEKSQKKPRRYLHAIFNNAGVGKLGYVDWAPLEHYKTCMDVNCFGTIRVVKTFLPILKKQAMEGSYTDAQILNMVSMAGMMSASGLAMTAYEVSKNAAEAFTDGLRLEMKMFGIKVVSINPSFHTTPLVANLRQKIEAQSWAQLSEEKRDEYGQDFFDNYVKHVETMMTTKQWDSAVAVDAITNAIKSSEPPSQLLIGTDARYSIVIMRMFPQWFRHYFVQLIMPSQVPSIMKGKLKDE